MDYYSDLLAKHGPTYAAVDAGSQYSHQRRLQVLSDFIPDTHHTILDVGCGLGHFIDYGKNWRKEGYLGIDILPEMVEAACKRRPSWHFEVGDISKPKSEWAADYVVASGLFQFSYWPFHRDAIRSMFRLCRKGIAYNFLRAGDEEKEYIMKPQDALAQALQLTPWVTLRADYLPNDFTLYLYKERP